MITRTKYKIIAVAALLIAAFVGYFVYSDFSVRKFDYTPRMTNFFKLHESELNELVKITSSEPKVFLVDIAAQAVPATLPKQKVQEIRSRLARLGLSVVETVSPEIRLFGGDYKKLPLGRFTGSYTYGYVYVPQPPKKVFASLNEITPQDGVGYVPLKRNWYLIGFFEE